MEWWNGLFALLGFGVGWLYFRIRDRRRQAARERARDARERSAEARRDGVFDQENFL